MAPKRRKATEPRKVAPHDTGLRSQREAKRDAENRGVRALLKGEGSAVCPAGGKCPICRRSLKRGFAYISGGALLLDRSELNSIETSKLRAFLNIGFHGSNPDCGDCVDAEIVEDLQGGQFDLNFCSFDCLEAWFERIVSRLRGKLRSQSDE
jgi:hypothetical protein